MAQNLKFTYRRGVAPIIATMFLVAFTVGGGAVTFSYAQDVINDTQISNEIHIESVVILGYDFRDIAELRSHNGLYMKQDTAGIKDGVKSATERIAIYVQNNGIKNVEIDELRFTGEVYEFSGSSNYLSSFVSNNYPEQGEYVILSTTPDIIIKSDLAILYPGKVASLVLGLDDSIKLSRHAMLKLTTVNGFVIVKNMVIGGSYDLHGVKCEAKEEEGGEGGSMEQCANPGLGGDSDSEGGAASNSGNEGVSETGGSTGSNTAPGSDGNGSSGSGSSGGSQTGVGSGSSGPAPSSSN